MILDSFSAHSSRGVPSAHAMRRGLSVLSRAVRSNAGNDRHDGGLYFFLPANSPWTRPVFESSSSQPASKSFSPSALSANTPPNTVLGGEDQLHPEIKVQPISDWLLRAPPTPFLFSPPLAHPQVQRRSTIIRLISSD